MKTEIFGAVEICGMTQDQAKKLWKATFKVEPQACETLTQGQSNYTFRVHSNNQSYILKCPRPGNLDYLKGSIYWIAKIQALGLPVPEILASDFSGESPFIVFRYFEGCDLGEVYSQLSSGQRKALARNLVQLQAKLKKLGPARGYGFLSSYEDPDYRKSWRDVVKEHITRSELRLEETAFFSPSLSLRVRQVLEDFEDYMETIEPLPFFDDIGIKNVLVHKGSLSGIVDLDWLGFGDELYVIGLIKMALLYRGETLDYVDYWIECKNLSDKHLPVLDFYTLVFCLDFMSEQGLNGEPVPRDNVKKLERIFWQLFRSLLKKESYSQTSAVPV